MKAINHLPRKSLGTCLIQAGALLFSIILLGYWAENRYWSFSLLFVGGWLWWTFTEYCIHRFLMHELVVPGGKSDLLRHQSHHQHPHDIKVKHFHRLMLLVVGMVLIYLLPTLKGHWIVLTGFFIGFLIYNHLHFLLHKPFGKYIFPKVQRAHILHHTRYPNCGYSFSTILWDWLFNTLPPSDAIVTPQMQKNFFGEA